MISITYILSQLFIIISYTLLAITYQIKNRKSILILSFMSIAATGLSYLFLSAYSGLAMVIVAAIRNVIFVVDEKKNGKRLTNTTKDYIILAVLYLISIIFAVFTYNGILSMISVVANSSFRSKHLYDTIVKEKCDTIGGRYILRENETFATASQASSVVLGRFSNGWKDWVDDRNKTLASVYRNT